MDDASEFELAGPITEIAIIAVSGKIRILPALKRLYDGRRWRKLKGKASVNLMDGSRRIAELHWYEAHGVGRVALKIKRFLD